MSARILVAFKQLFVSEIPTAIQSFEAAPSMASRAIEFINPLSGDPTSKFVNFASIFAITYGINCAVNMHHDHQPVVYPYMKSKRNKTLAHMFAPQV
eukprot:gene7859-9224_t